MSAIADQLLGWYDRHHRVLPWRTGPADRARGIRPDPYRVWLSEIMLQQTTVAAVAGYFERFTARWPTVRDLASAEDDEVMREWAGLGYYSRARNLLKTARAVAALPDAAFPADEVALLELPGIGPYTAAAIAAIAFDRRAVVVDGNVERVMARLDAVKEPLPRAKPRIRARVGELLTSKRPGDFAQAMMDLGATICTPRRPKCILCPVREGCLALAEGAPDAYPIKEAKKVKPKRSGIAYVAERPDGSILLRRRPESGLLGGMAEPPSTGWDGNEAPAPLEAQWKEAGAIAHTFTHFSLEMRVLHAMTGDLSPPSGCWWSPRETLAGEALPTVMKKVLEAAIPGATRRSRQAS